MGFDDMIRHGLPIDKRVKWKLTLTFFLLVLVNHNLNILSSMLNYQYREYVTLILLSLMVLFSIGSKLAETFVIALSIFTLISVSYDFSVLDISDLRRNVFIGSVIVLAIGLLSGEVGVYNFIRTLLGQFGIRRS